MLGDRYELYFELMREGKSPAQFDFSPRAYFKAFDIWDIQEETYLHPHDKYCMFIRYKIPHVACWVVTISRSTYDFEKAIDEMIDIAYVRSWEGFVAKWYHNEKLYAIKVKVEHKYGKQKKQISGKPKDTREPLERSEVTGAIDKVYNELQWKDFINVKVVMPLIANAVRLEEIKHNKKNRINLYHEYLTYLDNVNKNV